MKVSVIIPVHNRKEYVLRAIRSVKKSSSEAEIIVVKNYSDNNIDQSIEREGAINIVENSNPLGEKIRRGFIESAGDVICILEDDDTFAEGKIDRVKEIFENSAINFYHNRALNVNEMGISLGIMKNRIKIKEGIYEMPASSEELEMMHKFKMYYNTSSMAFRKEPIMGYMDHFRDVKLVMDTFLFQISLLAGGSFFNDATPFTNYTVHESASNISGKDFDDFISKAKNFFKIAYEDSLVSLRLSKGTSTEQYSRAWSIFLENSVSLFSMDLKNVKYVDLPESYSWVPFGKRMNFLIRSAIKAPEIVRRSILKMIYLNGYRIRKR